MTTCFLNGCFKINGTLISCITFHLYFGIKISFHKLLLNGYLWHVYGIHYCSKHSKDPAIVLLLNLEEMNLNLSVQCSQQSYLTKTSQHMYWHKDKHKKKKITIIAQKKSQHKYTPIAYQYCFGSVHFCQCTLFQKQRNGHISPITLKLLQYSIVYY